MFTRSANPDNAVVRSGFCAVVELGEGAAQTTEEYLSHFEEALMVISTFCRQRISVLGWEVKCDERQEQVWKNPLAPLDVLDDIRFGIESTDRSSDAIMDSIRSIEGELQWTNNISAVAQVIQAVDCVAAAIHEQT